MGESAVLEGAPARSPNGRPHRPARESGPVGILRRIGEGRIVVALVVVALISHSYNMLRYPLFLGDEGIYLEQAWAVLREGRLSPYTYFYDHAPVGWLMLAWWTILLPARFLTFGMAVASGRVLMLLLHLASVVLLYRITRKLGGGEVAGMVAVLIFSLSPLPLYYQRMILLDNLMVFWLLVSMHLILSDENRVLTLVGSGTAFGLAILTKENAIFFAPVLVYILYTGVRQSYRLRFALAGWAVTTAMIVSFYPLYALLNSELFPDLSSIFTNTPAEHVSLISTLLWQLGRRGGSILDPYSDFWTFFWSKWWQKDPFILAAGTGAALTNLLIGWSRRRRGLLLAALLALIFAFYLARGSVILEFYVVPVLPFLALNVGLLVDELLGRLPGAAATAALVVGLVGLVGYFVAGSYDHYTLDLTQLQARQLEHVRRTIPPSAKLLIDDDLWVDLHEPARGRPVYRDAHSHWKIANDPDIRDRLLRGDWRNLDYLVMSNKLDEEFQRQYTPDRLPVQALQNSTVIWSLRKGDVRLEIRKVNK